jgi:glutathione peroxidase
VRFLALALIVGLCASCSSAEDKGAPKMNSVLDFTLKDIKGQEVKLSQYKGKVLLLVNVASQCGLTPQYKELEALNKKYAKDGLVVIGIPANEFGAQEPGTNEEIAKFCTTKYDVTFPMMSKIVVKGKGIDPLYQFLTSKETNPDFAGDITWNFEKFLVGKDGKVIARFAPRVKPDDEKVIAAIEAALKK